MSNDIPDECMCCNNTGIDLECFPIQGNSDLGAKWLCTLCAGTMAGAWYDSRRNVDPNIYQLLKGMCFIGNEIIKEIRKRNEENS